MSHVENTNSEEIEKFSREVIHYLIKHPQTSRDKITNVKGRIGKKYKFKKVIKNATILRFVKEEEKELITKLLKRRTTRTLSGVSVIAIIDRKSVV